MLYKKLKLDNYQFFVRNTDEATRIYNEKFIKEEYKVDLEGLEPVIIDAGAHIGITSVYFKKLYPECTILAFEPDKTNYLLYKKNISINKLNKIKCLNFALSDEDNTTTMYTRDKSESTWTWANTIIKGIWGPNNPYNVPITVQSVKLSRYINTPVDLLKLDIEGAEESVLKELENKLNLVKNIIFEYHGTKYSTKINKIDRILLFLLRHNYEINVIPIDKRAVPSYMKKYINKVKLENYIIKARKLF